VTYDWILESLQRFFPCLSQLPKIIFQRLILVTTENGGMPGTIVAKPCSVRRGSPYKKGEPQEEIGYCYKVARN
jgi:hypothetical protein